MSIGMDFFNHYGAVIDCAKNTLSLSPVMNPLPLESKRNVPTIVSNVTISETVEIPARSKMLIRGTLAYPSLLVGQEGLLEPTYKGEGKLLVARSLNTVSYNNQLMVEVVNIGQAPITLYSGTTIASFSPNIAVHPITKKDGDKMNATMPNIDLNGTELNNSQRQELEALISEFRDLFVSPGQSLGRTSTIKHSIRVEGPPVRQPLRCIPFALQDTVQTEVQKMLIQRVIRESSSPWSSPVLMVKKKDGTWRFCVDYRKLNAITHKDAYPLPRIDETLESLSGSQFFTTLDLASGYWQVEVEGDKEKTAFST